MTQPIKLELSDRLMERAQETAQRTGHSVEMVLTQWVERGAEQAEAMTVLLNGPHHLYSPLGGEATAQELWAFLEAQHSHDDH